MKVTKITTIKNTTNGGDPSKQYFVLIEKNGISAIGIKKLILVDVSEINNWKRMGNECIKIFKSKALMYNHFSIKVSTFKTIANLLP